MARSGRALAALAGAVAPLGGSIAYIFRRFMIAALAFLAVGIGGSAAVWDRWSERVGAPNSFEAFFQPTGLAYDEAFLLATHAPFVVVGVAVLWYHLARSGGR